MPPPALLIGGTAALALLAHHTAGLPLPSPGSPGATLELLTGARKHWLFCEAAGEAARACASAALAGEAVHGCGSTAGGIASPRQRSALPLRAHTHIHTHKKKHVLSPIDRPSPPPSDKPPAFLEEAAGPRYVVEVDVDSPPGALDDPADLAPGARAMTLPGPGGVRYTCIIPPPPPEQEDDAASSGSSDDRNGSPPSPAALVASLDGSCLYRMEDWWTYEFCAGKHARQFHREADGPGGQPGAVVSEFILGRWNESEAADPVPRSDPGGGAPEEEVAYLSQEYGGGQACDLTGTPRGVEVRFVCADGGGSSGGSTAAKGSALDGVPAPSGPRDALLAVREPATCRYTFTVAVTDLCAHPAFRRAEPPTLVVRCALRGGLGDA